ncbi:hypothetical protein [Gottfriedia acidiceleris]|uniref:hypothetical protein n=1 Tax=Gottfriedia acidiceleris TaxID=371036 RepID=UPI003D19226E
MKIKIAKLGLFIFIISGCSNKEVIYEVGNLNITNKEFNDYVKEKYHDIAFEDLINSKLLEAKADEKNLKFEFEGEKIKPTDKDFLLKAKPIVREILRDYIDEESLENYYKENLNKFTNKVIKVDVFKIDHNLALDFIKLYNEGKTISEVMKSLSLKDNVKISMEIDRENEIYKKLEKIEEGKLTMIMEESEHYLVIVNEIVNSNKMNWPKDKDKILDKYISNNLGDEYLKLLGTLKEEYKVVKKSN